MRRADARRRWYLGARPRQLSYPTVAESDVMVIGFPLWREAQKWSRKPQSSKTDIDMAHMSVFNRGPETWLSCAMPKVKTFLLSLHLDFTRKSRRDFLRKRAGVPESLIVFFIVHTLG